MPNPDDATSTTEALYTCDELTPGLCALRETTGTLLVRGLRLNYKIFDPPSTSPPPPPSTLPIVMVHGGPGWSHDYMLPLKQQACRGRRVIFYDQVGAGLSERPASANATAPWLLSLDYYPQELQRLVDHLQLGRFHLLGSSWGTVVAQLYALQTPPPPQLASLVLSGPLSDGQLYIRSQWDEVEGGLGTLPPFTKRRIRRLEALPGGFETDEYKLLNEALEAAFTVRTFPAPDCFRASAAGVNAEVYVGMQGASEFTIGGALAFWSVTEQLRRVATPALLTHGAFDTMRPPVLRAMAAALPHARVVQFPHSGHCSMIDDPQLMNDAVAEFVSCVEASGADAAACAEGGEYSGGGLHLQPPTASRLVADASHESSWPTALAIGSFGGTQPGSWIPLLLLVQVAVLLLGAYGLARARRMERQQRERTASTPAAALV